MIIQEPVQAAIWHCLNHYDHKDAVFLAERLCCEVESDETVFILATSYYRSNQIHQAYWLLKEKARRSSQCRYLQAKCAYQLKKYAEAECILTSSTFADIKNFDDLIKDFGEVACFALQLVAQICLKTERSKLACDALRKALKLNPFMWHAFVDLCELGEETEPSVIFQIANTDIFNTCQGNANTNSMILFPNNNNDGFVNNNSLNNSNYILNTPVDQYTQSHQNISITTPNNNINNNNINNNNSSNNNNNLNSSISILLRGSNTTGHQANNNNQNISGMMMLDDTPVGYTTQDQTTHEYSENSACTPFRSKFKYLTTVSPLTPSFGVLPLNSPCIGDSSLTSSGGGGGGNNSVIRSVHNHSHSNMNNVPSPQTLVEVNQEQKFIGNKKARHVGNLINRKETNHTNTHKPAVFTQAGNITPRTPNNNGIPPLNAAVRRSSRLFGNNAYSVKENNKSPNITNSKFLQPRSPPRKTKTRISKICLNNEIIEEKTITHNTDKYSERNYKKEKIETITSATGNNRHIEDSKVLHNNSLNNAQTMAHQVLQLKKQSADGLMSLLREIGEGYKLLANYQCKKAIKQFEAIVPKHHLSSSWVQSLIAIANYEMREYEAAMVIFKRIHELEPNRLEFMEVYSSTLWHLQKEVDLSALAQDFMNQDKKSPITWCVSGNCFSLHKEHETAIKFFKRAVQVEPEFVYSYTLLGHELVLTEELDRALDFFRAAVIRDPRHYNAWFGIGTIYSKQEKYELAELHYIKALKINPLNSVILVHIGAMQFYMHKKEQALQTLNTAVTLEPKNALARFHRGTIFFSLGRQQEALRELEELKEIVPKESVVFYLIGKIHKALGNVDLALMNFSWATDLDPKGANNQIKDAFDSMSHPNSCPAKTTEQNPEIENEQEQETEQEREAEADVEAEPISERSDDSTQAQQDVNYDSDAY